MKREYDFSKAAKGKFYKRGVKLRIPIYLDEKLQNQLGALARKKGRGIEEVVRELLKKDMELIKTLL